MFTASASDRDIFMLQALSTGCGRQKNLSARWWSAIILAVLMRSWPARLDPVYPV